MTVLPIVGLIVAVLIVIVLLLALRQMVNIVQQGQVGVVKRLGEYRFTHEPGLVIISPFIDSLQRVDMREIPVPGDRQDVITRDNVVVTVNATIFTQVVDAQQALFSVKNFDVAIDALARTALRSVIGTMTLDDALSERERINTDVQQQMEVVTDKWGIRISRIEIVEIAPPPQILLALALQKQADQEKRATILESEGRQQSAINVAEGDAQAAVRAAQGQRQAAILRAEGASPGRHPGGRRTGPGHRHRLRRHQGRGARPDVGGHPPARRARSVRRQPQRQDRRALRERRDARRRAGPPERPRLRHPGPAARSLASARSIGAPGLAGSARLGGAEERKRPEEVCGGTASSRRLEPSCSGGVPGGGGDGHGAAGATGPIIGAGGSRHDRRGPVAGRQGLRAVREGNKGQHHRRAPPRVERLPRQPRAHRPEHLRPVRRRRGVAGQGGRGQAGAVRRQGDQRHRRRQHRRQPAGRRPVLRRALDDRHQPHARRLRVGRQPRVRQGLGRAAEDPERRLRSGQAARRSPTRSPTARRPTRTPVPTSSTCRPTSSATTTGRRSSRPTASTKIKSDSGKKFEIGIIGEVLEATPTIVTPAGVAGLTFQDEADAANKVVKQLQQEGCRTRACS